MLLLLLVGCASSTVARQDPSEGADRPVTTGKESESEDPVSDAYLKEQESKNGGEEVPVRIDTTGDSDGEAFVVTTDTAAEDTSDGGDGTGPSAEDRESGSSDGTEESGKSEADQERLARLEAERKAREEARREEEERKRKEAELRRMKNEAIFHREAFEDRKREFEIARKEHRIKKLTIARDARLASLDPKADSFWKRESEERFGPNPAFEIEADIVYLVPLADPLQYQSSRPVQLPGSGTAIQVREGLSIWQTIKGKNGRWILMQETKDGYVPLKLKHAAREYRVALIEVGSGIVRLEIYSRSNSRRAGQYHILYPVELELIP